jgi:hypothetical protein
LRVVRNALVNEADQIIVLVSHLASPDDDCADLSIFTSLNRIRAREYALNSLSRDEATRPSARRALDARSEAQPARCGSAIRFAAASQDFLPAGGTLWPPAASDFLYSDIVPLGLSDFGFLASLALRICPLAIDSS